jgi:group I intron endonuclease
VGKNYDIISKKIKGDKIMIGIYKITNLLNGHSYIGLSTHIEDRWEYHKNPYNWNREKNKSLYKAILKYGIENFSFEILE